MKILKFHVLTFSLVTSMMISAQPAQRESATIQELRSLATTGAEAVLLLFSGYRTDVSGRRVPADPPQYRITISEIHLEQSATQITCPHTCIDYDLHYRDAQGQRQTMKLVESLGKRVLYFEGDGDIYRVLVNPYDLPYPSPRPPRPLN